jgi:chemotaxis signal transduction protein
MPAHEDKTASGDKRRSEAGEAERNADATGRERSEGGDAASGAEPRELLLMHVGQLSFALYAEEVETVTFGLRRAPFPHALSAVLGIIAARGRMRTALDPLQLLADASGPEPEAGTTAPAFEFVACLRGDEQLAVAFERAERAHFSADELLTHEATTELPVRGLLVRGGQTVFLLDSTRIFAAAVRGTERRRTRRAP